MSEAMEKHGDCNPTHLGIIEAYAQGLRA